jgi:hypothetical protein
MGKLTQVTAYTFHTILQIVPANIIQRSLVGSFIQFNAGYAAVTVLGAQQYTQCAAAGTQIQHPGFWGQLCEIAE